MGQTGGGLGKRLRPACAVQRGVDLSPRLRRDPRHAFELLGTRGEDPLGRSEVLDERATACRPNTGKRVKDRFTRTRVAPLAVEAKGKAMCLVTDPLQELEPRRGG